MPGAPLGGLGAGLEEPTAQREVPGAPEKTATERREIVLLVPPAHGRVPDESLLVCPPEICFVALGLALERLALDAYGAAADRARAVAGTLAERAPAAVSLMGTSLSFFGGQGVEQRLREDIAELAGCPSTTMASAVVRALRALGCSRPAVVTAYTKPVDDALLRFLVAYGIHPGPVTGLGFSDVLAVEAVPTATLVAAARRALSGTPGADSIVISCGGLHTLDAVLVLEAELGVPVVSSSLAGPWDVLGLAGHAPMVPRPSQLLTTAWEDFDMRAS